MKHRKLPSFIALSISLELVLSPTLAMAQNQNKPSATETIMTGLNMAQGLYNQFRGNQQGQMPPHVATDMAALQKQQTPIPDKHFTLDNMSKIPGLMEYIAKKNQQAAATGGKPINPAALNCSTLPTTLFEAKNEVCRMEKISMTSGVDPRLQADEAFAYFNQYEQINKLYRNYSVRKNDGGQGFGYGCMMDAMEILNGFFAYRLEQLDTMVAEFEAATARFEEQSEMDLKAIRESTAILNGENSRFGAEFANTDIFDYGKRFEDPACNSMMSKDDMDKLGKSGGGLLAIDKKLKTELATTPPGSKYNAEQYLKKNADITNEIRKMADDVSKQAQLNFSSIANSPDGYGAFLSQIGGSVNTDSGAHQGLNRAFFSDLQTKFTESRKKLNDEVSVLKSELGNKGAQALSLLSDIDSDASFEAELGTLENEIKGECISRSGIDSALDRIYDPTLSKEANKHTSAQLKKRIKAVLEDSKLSPEKKLQELQAIEAQTGNRYELKLDANYEVNELKSDGSVSKKMVKAASKITPKNYFSDVIKNCEAQFQVNKLNNKFSAKEALQKLRTLKKDYQKTAKDHSKAIKDEIVKKMIDCGGNAETAASTTVATCSPAKLDMTSPGFCTKAAFSCSKNMQQCAQKAANFVKQIKDDRLKRTNNYNNNVEANRKQLVAMFDTTLSKYMKEAESLRGMFGAGFVAPRDIQRDIKDDSKYDQKFLSNSGDALQIKDPKKYLEMIKDNMTNLRAQVEQQQKAIMDKNGPLQQHIDETMRNYKEEVLAKSEELARSCDKAYRMYDQMITQQQQDHQKNQGELGEKKAELCGRYDDIMSSNPIPGCDDGYADVSDAAIKAAIKAGDYATANQAKMLRQQMRDVCSKPGNQRNKEGKSNKKGSDVCREALSNKKLADEIAKVARTYSTLEDVKDNTKAVNLLCGVVRGDKASKEKVCGVEETKNETTNVKTYKILDCGSEVEDTVVSTYTGMFEDSLLADVDSTPRHASADTGSFCNGSNNSGPFNTKGGFPSMQNPLDAQTAQGRTY